MFADHPAYEPRRHCSETLPRRVARWSVVLSALWALLVVAGCTSHDELAGSGAAPTTRLSSPLANLRPLPVRLGGGRFDPASVAGRPVVLWFWAPWCPICRSEGPTIAKVAADFSGKVSFIGVAGQGTTSAMNSFVKQTHTDGLTHIADVSGAVWRDYGVSVQPAFAFITADGTADLRVGGMDEQTLRARVAELASGATTSTMTITPGSYCSRAPDGRLVCGASGPPHSTTTTGTLTR